MNFEQAIRSGFVNYFNFTGRACRSEYWFWVLFLIIADIAVDIADILIFGDASYAITLIFNLGVVIPAMAVSVRRLHDIDKTGWWSLLLLTVVGLFVLLYWTLKPGDEGENRFGHNPLTHDGSERDAKRHAVGVKGAIIICLVFAGILAAMIALDIVASIARTAYEEYALRAQKHDNQMTLPVEESGTERLDAP